MNIFYIKVSFQNFSSSTINVIMKAMIWNDVLNSFKMHKIGLKAINSNNFFTIIKDLKFQKKDI